MNDSTRDETLREELDAEFARMATDAAYQVEAEKIAREFEGSELPKA